MSAAAQSGEEIDVELPSHWEEDVDEATIREIHELTQRVDQTFRGAGFENDLESVRVKDSGDTPGRYLGRSKDDEGEPTSEAVMDVASDNSEREGSPENSQEDTFAHELGHDYFRNIVLGKEGEKSGEMDELLTESPSVYMTLNEAFADLTCLTHNSDGSINLERNPFKHKYQDAFEVLEQAFNTGNREKELGLLREIRDSADQGDYADVVDKLGDAQERVPDVDFRPAYRTGRQYNVFLVGLEDFFMTETGESTAVNQDRARYFAEFGLSESPELHPGEIVRYTHGAYDDREIGGKVREVLGVDNLRDCDREGVEEVSGRVIDELISERLEPTIDQVEDQISTIASVDIGEYVFDRMDYDQYGSSDGRVDEDMDLPHEVGGVLAEVLYENNTSPVDIAENPMKYAEMTRQVIKETIGYGVEVASGEAEQEWGEQVTEEYKTRIGSII